MDREKSRFTDEPIIGFFYQVEAGAPMKHQRRNSGLRARA